MHDVRPASLADGLHAGLDRVLDADLAELGDRTLLGHLGELYRAEARLAAAKARAIAAVEARTSYGIEGAQSTAQWITHRCRVPAGAARHDVALARSLRSLPATEALLADGQIGEPQAAAIGRHERNERVADELRRFEPVLAEQAARLDHRVFTRVLAYWAQEADEDGTDADAEARRTRRRFSLSRTFEGEWVVDGQLDPIAGATLDTALRAVEDELYDADRAAGSLRTVAQRRADALVELAVRGSSAAPGARRPAPLVSILVGYETFAGRICELADGTVLAPGSVAALLDQAVIERVVFDGPARAIEISHQRLFTGGLRRIIEIRDRECTHPLCDAPFWRCDVDHALPWEAGGATTQENGRGYCPFHNHLRQRRGPPVPA